MALLVAAAIALGAGFFYVGFGAPDAQYADALLQREVVTLAPGVHLLGRLRPSVAYAVETPAGLVLIDSGLQPDAADLIDQLRELGLDVAQLRAILLTHAHGDHTLGARHLRELTGAKVYAGQGDAAPLRDGGPREAFFSTFNMEGHAVHATPVDVELAGGEELVFGDARITALATPGHTPGSVCYLLQRNGLRVLFGGDAISSLFADLGTYSTYLAPKYRGDARDYLQSLRKLRSLPAPHLVLPGHPNEQGQPHSPRIPADQWRQLLDRGIRDMEILVARYDADGEDFLDGRPKELLPGLHYLGEYHSRSVLVLRAGGRLLLFDAPGDDGLAAFVAGRLAEAKVAPPAIGAVLMTSADPDATGGLASIVAAHKCQVYARADGRGAIRAACPDVGEIASPDSLAYGAELAIHPLALDGCGPGATAYALRLDNRRVLVTGAFPSTQSDLSIAHVRSILNASQRRSDMITASLSKLRDQYPDVWVPAYPLNGRNANLYDDQWETILLETLQMVRR